MVIKVHQLAICLLEKEEKKKSEAVEMKFITMKFLK